ncbi:MAG: hypothetical protein U0835_05090 [Isosphaeraceae bacterium]
MADDAREMKFLATTEKGEVSAASGQARGRDAPARPRPRRPARTCVSSILQTISERLAEVGVATFRYNFPYSEHGKGRDSQGVCTATVRSAVRAAGEAVPTLPSSPAATRSAAG